MGTFRLERLTLTNYRGFEALDLTFEPDLTVLVGANGSGKTSVIDAILCAVGMKFSASDVHLGAEEWEILLQAGNESTKVSRVRGAKGGGPSFTLEPGPFLVHYPVQRSAIDKTPGASEGKPWQQDTATEGALDAPSSYDDFFRWFRDMEDYENQEKVDQKDLDLEVPQLSAVREAVGLLLPGFRNLRVRRDGAMGDARPRLTVEKEGVVEPLLLDALSEGERNLLVMVADIARRLATRFPGADSPLGQPFVLIVDEIEQHLHPGWQRRVLEKLQKVFSAAQIIVTTQSPIVVSEVDGRCLRVLQDFELVSVGHRAGKDVNAVLEDAFDTTPRRERESTLLQQVQDAIDDREYERARSALDALEKSVGPDEPDVFYYRSLLDQLAPAASSAVHEE